MPNGFSQQMAYDSLWKLDPASGNWTWLCGSQKGFRLGFYGQLGVEDARNIPPGRIDAIGWNDRFNNPWIFGGYTSGGLSDLWSFNLKSGCWTWVQGPNTPNQVGIYGTLGRPDPTNRPSGRYGQGCWMDKNGHPWIFGGNGITTSTDAGGVLNDLWKLTLPNAVDGRNWMNMR